MLSNSEEWGRGIQMSIEVVGVLFCPPEIQHGVGESGGALSWKTTASDSNKALMYCTLHQGGVWNMPGLGMLLFEIPKGN